MAAKLRCGRRQKNFFDAPLGEWPESAWQPVAAPAGAGLPLANLLRSLRDEAEGVGEHSPPD